MQIYSTARWDIIPIVYGVFIEAKFFLSIENFCGLTYNFNKRYFYFLNPFKPLSQLIILIYSYLQLLCLYKNIYMVTLNTHTILLYNLPNYYFSLC